VIGSDKRSSKMEEVIQYASELGYYIPTSQSLQEERGDRSAIDEHSEALLSILSSIETLKAEQITLSSQMKLLSDHNKTADFTAIEELESKNKIVEDISTHFATIVDCKEVLLGRLQQEHIGDVISVHAFSQKNFQALMEIMAHMISHVNSTVGALGWLKSFKREDPQIPEILSGYATFVAKCQTFYESLSSFREKLLMLQQSAKRH